MRYLEALVALESDPSELESICEPFFYRKAVQGWTDLKGQKMTAISLLNSPPTVFKSSLVHASLHYNGYMDRDVDVLSRS